MRAELELALRQVRRRRTRHPALTAVCAAIVSGVAIFAGYPSLHGPPAAPNIRSLAVLPLEDLSPNKSHAYFSDGITEQLIADLSTLNGVRVISRPSVMSFKLSHKPLSEIAAELNVDALITGSIAGSAARVRINTKLTRLRPEKQKIWAESYERSVDELPSLQLEVATTIAHQIRKSLPPKARSQISKVSTVNAEARDLYYMGRYNANKVNEEGYLKAIGFFEKAIAKDPSYAAAYSGLGYAYAQLSSLAFHYMSPLAGMPKAKAAVLKALELDDTLADAHTWLAFVKLTFDRDWTGAEHEIRRALALNPNSADAHVVREWYLVAMRRFDEAHQEVEHARELDPLSLRAVNEDQWVKIGARRYGEAIELGAKAIDAEPQFVPAMFSNAFAYTEKGNFPKAISLARNAIRLQNVPSNVLLLAHVVARAGDYAWAQHLISQQKKAVHSRYLCPYEVATAYVSMNRKAEAYAWLRKAVNDRVDCMIYLEAEPWMDSLRQDPEYRRLLEEMNLPAN
jgi:TolB-like protein/Tfp pilus assembly protein PilF